MTYLTYVAALFGVLIMSAIADVPLDSFKPNDALILAILTAAETIRWAIKSARK